MLTRRNQKALLLSLTDGYLNRAHCGSNSAFDLRQLSEPNVEIHFNFISRLIYASIRHASTQAGVHSSGRIYAGALLFSPICSRIHQASARSGGRVRERLTIMVSTQARQTGSSSRRRLRVMGGRRLGSAMSMSTVSSTSAPPRTDVSDQAALDLNIFDLERHGWVGRVLAVQ